MGLGDGGKQVLDCAFWKGRTRSMILLTSALQVPNRVPGTTEGLRKDGRER